MPIEFADDPRFALARTVILEAGALALEHFGALATLTVETKAGGQDVVSIADRAVEDLIRTRLAEGFPDDGFLGEESGTTAGRSGFTWVVDPIDGTSCFLHGLPDWCVSIALIEGEDTRLGLILHPLSGQLFVAAYGRGAYLDGQPMKVDAVNAIGSGLVGLGANLRVPAEAISGFADGLLREGGMFFRNGSGALMLAYVACGRLVAYYEPHINAWDCLAALLMIREAGGWTQEFPLGAAIMEGGPVVAAAPQVRAPLLALIAATAPAR